MSYYVRDTGYVVAWRKSPVDVFDKYVKVAFAAGAKLATPTLSSPVVGRISSVLRWTRSLRGITYILQRATNVGFTANLTTVFSGYDGEFHDSGLTANTTYFYRIKVQATGYTDSDYSNTVSVTTINAYRTFDVTVPGGDGGKAITDDLYYDAPSNNVYPIQPGDTFRVFPAAWSYFALYNLVGTKYEPITIINEGNVDLTAGFEISNCMGLRVTGSGTKSRTYGFHITGTHTIGLVQGVCFNLKRLNSYIELDNFKADTSGYGIQIKNEVGDYAADSDCGAQFWYPASQHDIEIHHFQSDNMNGDNLYIGSSDSYGLNRTITCGSSTILPRPTQLYNIEIHDFTLSQSGRQGIQWSAMVTGTNSIYNFTITDSGQEYNEQQGAGIAVGTPTSSLAIYNGTINGSFRQGIYSYGYGNLRVEDVTFTNIGTITKNTNPAMGYYIVKLTLVGKTIDSSFVANGGLSNPGSVIQPAGSEYTFEIWKIDGSTIELKTHWTSLTTPSVSEINTIINASTTPKGSHSGSYADPYVGFGASATITSGEIQVMSRGGLQYGQGCFMMNNFHGQYDVAPATFELRNLTFNDCTAAEPVAFLASNYNYGTGNIICGCTFEGSPLTNLDIYKEPLASALTWTLTNSC